MLNVQFFFYPSSTTNLIALLILHIKHYQQLEVLTVVIEEKRFQFLLNLSDMHIQIQ